MKSIVVVLCSSIILSFGTPVFQDGVMIGMREQLIPDARQFFVIDSFPAGATNYSMGLACDGEYIWNDETFLHWFARMDTATGAVVNSFSTTIGNRDMTFDGQYLWASDWNAASISKFDTATCTVVNTYYPPFYAGKPHGLAWDGTHLWVGEESGRIHQMTLTGDTVRSIPSPVYYPYDPRGLAFDGHYLWVGYQSSGLIYKVDTANGAVLETFTAPGVVSGQRFQQGLACDGAYLWSTVGGAVQMIYKIDIGLTGIKEHANAPEPTIFFSARRNPFVKKIVLQVTISEPVDVNIFIANAAGRILDILENGMISSGTHSYIWNAVGHAPGVYFGVLHTARTQKTLKLINVSD
ncbi:hypothetical protein JXB22_05445 [candidate division WOR-3 bacterium]|nr:hypothetical protein [candidate division WOR-3 bacterium]